MQGLLEIKLEPNKLRYLDALSFRGDWRGEGNPGRVNISEIGYSTEGFRNLEFIQVSGSISPTLRKGRKGIFNVH